MSRNRQKYRTQGRGPESTPAEISLEPKYPRITFREFLKGSLALAGLGITAAVFGLPIYHSLNDEDQNGVKYLESVYRHYEDSLALVASKSPSARPNLEWIRKSRIKASIHETKNGAVNVNPERVPDPRKEIITAVLDRVQTPITFKNFSGAAGVGDWQDVYPLFLLRNDSVSSVWAGALMAHEITHAMKRVSQTDDPTDANVRVGSELEAYKHQFAVLDEYTDGNFSNRVRSIAKKYLDSGRANVMLDEAGIAQFDDLFGPSQSDIEKGSRIANITFAVNFELIASKYPQNPDRIKIEQFNYLYNILIPKK